MPHKMQIQYDDMENIAKLLQNMAEDTDDSVTNIQTVVDFLQGGDWKGVGAEKFYDEMDSDVFPKLKVLKQGFETASQQVKQAIGKYQEAEQTILSYFASIQ